MFLKAFSIKSPFLQKGRIFLILTATLLITAVIGKSLVLTRRESILVPRSKVLIIADNVESANVWEDALRRRCIESIHLGYGVQTPNIFLPEPNSFALSLVDSQTGGDTALAICASVRAMSDKPILLLTPENDERYQLKAYDAGVDEYLVTPANVLLVTAKIKVWLQRVAAAEHLSEELSESGFRLNPKTHQVFTPDGKAVKLSAHELRLLRLLLANPGRVLPTDFLISRVWSHDAHGDKKLLINLVYRLRQKIDSRSSRGEHIQRIPGEGYRWKSSEAEDHRSSLKASEYLGCTNI